MAKVESKRVSESGASAAGKPTLIVARPYRALRTLLRRKRARGVLQLLLSAVLLIWLGRRVGLDQIVQTLAGVSWSWYLPAFGLFVVNVVIRAYRWHVLLAPLDTHVSFPRLVYLYFLGFFFNNFIPSGFGGDIVKVLSLPKEEGQGAEALSSVIADRMTGFIGSSGIALIALTWNGIQTRLGQSTGVSLPPTILLSVAVISLGGPLAFVMLRRGDPLRRLSARLPVTRRLIERGAVQRLFHTLRCYPPSTLGQALLVSLPFTVNLVFIQYSIARALSVEVPFRLFPLFVPLIAIINVLPLSFNGLGMREGAYQLLFVPAGVSNAGAMAMSLAFYILRVGAGLLGGFLYALRSVRHLTRAARNEED